MTKDVHLAISNHPSTYHIDFVVMKDQNQTNTLHAHLTAGSVRLN